VKDESSVFKRGSVNESQVNPKKRIFYFFTIVFLLLPFLTFGEKKELMFGSFPVTSWIGLFRSVEAMSLFLLGPSSS
jgi:hypothetical protein